MPQEYSVDDILAEVLGDRATKKSEKSAPAQKADPIPQAATAVEEKPASTVKAEPEKINIPLHVDTLPTQVVNEEMTKMVMQELKKPSETPALKFPIEIEGLDEEPDEEAAQPVEDESIEDFESYSQRDSIWQDLRSLSRSVILRLVVTAIGSLALIVLAVMQFFPDAPLFFNPHTDPIIASAIGLGVLTCCAFACYPTMASGLSGLFRFKANSDSLPAMLPIVASIQLIFMMFFPDKAGEFILFAPFAALALFFNAIGKRLMVSRIESGFEMVSDDRSEKYSCDVIDDSKLTYELTKSFDASAPLVCVSRPANFLSDFIKNSYTEDSSDLMSRIVAPLVVFGSLAIGVTHFLIHSNVALAVNAVCAVMALATPFTSTLCCNFPLWRAGRKAARHGGLITGSNALNTVGEANSIYFDCADLFFEDTIFLHHFETFGDFKIDDCFIDAASITKSARMPLSTVFMKIIQGNEKFLKKVDSLTYEDEMGLSAWVGSKRVLLGNRELLRTHGIEVPAREFEAKHKRDGREIVYLANSGEIAAFFVVSYNADPEVAATLQRLSRNKMMILIKNCDCNITARKLEYIFKVSDEYLEIVPQSLSRQCDVHCAETMNASSKAAHKGGLVGFATTLMACISAKVATGLAVTLQMGSIILGFALVSFFTFVGGAMQIDFITTLGYQLFWLVAILLFPNLRKY